MQEIFTISIYDSAGISTANTQYRVTLRTLNCVLLLYTSCSTLITQHQLETPIDIEADKLFQLLVHYWRPGTCSYLHLSFLLAITIRHMYTYINALHPLHVAKQCYNLACRTIHYL